MNIKKIIIVLLSSLLLFYFVLINMGAKDSLTFIFWLLFIVFIIVSPFVVRDYFFKKNKYGFGFFSMIIASVINCLLFFILLFLASRNLSDKIGTAVLVVGFSIFWVSQLAVLIIGSIIKIAKSHKKIDEQSSMNGKI